MKESTFSFALTALMAAFAMPGAAQTTDFTDASEGDSLITNPDNWDNGLPIGQQGTITVDAGWNEDSNFSHDGYDILHTGGALSPGGFTASGVTLGTGTSWLMNGEEASFSGTRGIRLNDNATFTVTQGNANVSANGARTILLGTSVLTINGGVFTSGGVQLNGGSLVVNGGEITGPDLGSANNGSGVIELNGGTADFNVLRFGEPDLSLTFGGDQAGTLVIDDFGGFRHDPNDINMDYLPGSLMSMEVTNATEASGSGDNKVGWLTVGNETGLAWAEQLWSDGRLSYNDKAVSGVDILGEGGTTVLTWAQAQVDLGDGAYFVFNSSSNTLSLGGGGGTTPVPLQVTSFEPVPAQSGVWEVKITGAAAADFIFRSAADLDFSSVPVMENLVAGNPAVGTIGGSNNSVVTTDGGGLATVRMTLSGDPAEFFVRAEDAP